MEIGHMEPAGEERIYPQRCTCNKLVCVIKNDDVEIRCNKCKRHVLIRTRGIIGTEITDQGGK